MWADNESRMVSTEAAKATGLPVWVAFTASIAPDGQTVRMSMGDERHYTGGLGVPMWTSNWRTVEHEMTLVEGIGEIAQLRPDVLGVFHARNSVTTAALQVMLNEWSGPMVAYPDAGREDYLETWRDGSVANEETADELMREAADWVGMGAQIIGTCCGFGVDYIKALRAPCRTGSHRREGRRRSPLLIGPYIRGM